MRLSGREKVALAAGAVCGLLLAGLLVAVMQRGSGASFALAEGLVDEAVEQRDSLEIARAAVDKCGRRVSMEKVSCYEKLLVPLTSSAGVRTAMGALGSIGRLDRDVARHGHVYAHAIGIAALAPGKDVSTTFGSCNELYQSGCYHGVIQAYFEELQRQKGESAFTGEDVNAVCQAFDRAQERWLLFQCVHGLGHGLTMVHGHDLVLALEGCDLLVDAWDRESCYGGAFMENIVNVTNPHHPAAALAKSRGDQGHQHAAATGRPPFKALDPTDLHYPCSILDARYQNACYQMQTSAILWHNQGDIAAAGKTCDAAPQALRTVCHQSLGRDISSYALQDHEESIRLCSLSNPRYQPWCYVGLVKNFVDLTARTDNGFAFCGKVPGVPNRMKCYEAVGEQIAVLESGQEGREALCSQSQPTYLEACRFGARLTPRKPDELPVATLPEPPASSSVEGTTGG
jgi:hypothetical protein